jgi:hypothetical protein
VELRKLAARCRRILVVEMSNGQMIEDVRLAFSGTDLKPEIDFLGRGGGWYPKPKELFAKVMEVAKR